MKKIILIAGMILLSISSFSYNLIVSGYILDKLSQKPVENHIVEVSIDSVLGTSYHSILYTDSNGYYRDVIPFPDSVNGFVFVMTDSCDYFASSENYFSLNNSQISNDFAVCEDNSGSCFAYYTYYQIGDQYALQFLDGSSGGINSWYWDFGDGSYSTLQNPVHSFPYPGQFLTTLTIEGDSCFDYYQSIISIPEDTVQKCEAFFIYNQSVQHQMTIDFLDLSLGNVVDWYWSFGDGNNSTEQNPVHSYTLPGNYMVSLNITTIDSCTDIYTEEIWVWGDTLLCKSDFNFQLDTLNNTPHRYKFFDNSTGVITDWFWDFGDGTFSTLQNPTHIYETGGNYTVCLTITSNDGVLYCVSDTCQSLQTMEYFDFGGQVFINDYPINVDSTDEDNIAKVHLYRKIENSWYYMDSREFWKYGYYWFAQKPEGEYMIFTELSEGSLSYNSYSPTYFPNTTSWKGAGTFTLDDSDHFAVNIHLNKLAEMQTGTGTIKGNVFGGISCFTGDIINTKDVLVQLLNEDSKVVAFTYSNDNSNFEFNGVGNGTYRIRAEYPGKYSETYTVLVDQMNIPVEQNLEIHCYHILDIDTNAEIDIPEISGPIPNPASKCFTMGYNGQSNSVFTISVFNLSGNMVLNKTFSFNGDSRSQEFNIECLTPGYYTIKIHDQSTNNVSFTKLIITN